MNKLIAIPFDTYTSKFTKEGIIYNIKDCDTDEIVVQIDIAHIKYVLNDLGIEQMPGAPENCLSQLRKVLNEKYGKGQWKYVTCLNYKHHFSKIKNVVSKGKITPQTVRLRYSPKQRIVEYISPIENPQNGF